MNSLVDPVLINPYKAYISRYRKLFGAGLLSLFGTNALDAVAPYMIGMVIDQIVEHQTFHEVSRTVGLIFLVTAALAVCRFLWRFFWGQFHHTIAEDLRNRLYAKFTDLGPAFFGHQTTGGLMSLINNDVNSFRMAIGPGVLVLFDSLFLLMMVPVLMWRISPEWTWRCLILMPLVPFVVKSILKRTEAAYRKQQTKFSEMAGATQEIVAGIRVIKSYAQELNQTIRFNSHSRRYQEACNQVAQVDAAFGPALEIAAAVGSVILLFICVTQVQSGAVTLGGLFAFYQYIQKMVWPMEGLGIAFSHFQVGRAAFSRIREQLLVPVDTPDVGQAEPKDVEILEVKNLSFSYPGETRKILENISFTLRKGEVLGIVGATGAGKSTLAELLCHLYPVDPQTIWINHLPIEQIKKHSLRSLIALVPQETFVFSKQIDENLMFGSETQDFAHVREGANLVKMDQEIESWPSGYATIVGERGVNLSGGQRQRVTLARALLKKSPLVIIDDALSAVDAKTSLAILSNLRTRLGTAGGCAAIVISHRLGNVAWADKIMVLQNGKIEAMGKHEELLHNSPTYRQLSELQEAAGEA